VTGGLDRGMGGGGVAGSGLIREVQIHNTAEISVAYPLHLGTDPDPWIRTFD
jgi:hypothetical protein